MYLKLMYMKRGIEEGLTFNMPIPDRFEMPRHGERFMYLIAEEILEASRER